MSTCRASLSATTTAIGKVVQVEGCDVPVNTFLGLPYAQPPVGELRFCPPQSQELWTGERDCTEFGVICPQPWEFAKLVDDMLGFSTPEKMSEDCLYLNVYTPNVKPDTRLPVMVWIHGGGFTIGSGFTYDGSVLSGLHDVVVVTINYRLGILGFLATGDDVIPGNNGLLDQVEALKWVQRHITSFGGDPDNVTIFGESAGGMSCSLHLVSELASGLFHRAIAQSGACTSPYAVSTQEQARKLLQPLLEPLGYSGNTSRELVEFLRGRTMKELGDMGEAMFCFKPVIDGYYLKDYPHNLYHLGQFSKVPIIAGITSHEGYGSVKAMLSTPDESEEDELSQLSNKILKKSGLTSGGSSVKNYIKLAVNMQYFENQDAITDALYGQYITDEAVKDAELLWKQLCEIFKDVPFTGPNNAMVNPHSGEAPVYVYTYAYRDSKSKNAPWVGASHGEDLPSTFGYPVSDSTFTDEDKTVSKVLMQYWTNFAKTGDPNGSGLTNWSPFSKQQKACLILNEKTEVIHDVKPDITEFYEKEMPKLDTGRCYKYL